jgi:replicative DNA helicase
MTEFATGGGGQSLVPPQALDAERSVLAAMMLDEGAIGRAIEMIEASAFYRTSHAKLFDALVGLYNARVPADLITVAEELKKRGDLEAVGGPQFLAQVMEYATTAANLEQHIKIVYSKAILRQLIKATTEIQQQAYAGSEETAEVLDQAEARIFAITDQRIREGFTGIRELLKPTFDNIQKLFERKVQVTGVPSGWDDLDKLTSGWQPGDLVILAGRPSMGKSSAAVNMAENAAIRHNVPVAIFSLEMSKEQLAMRLLCSQSEVSLQKVRTGYLGNEDWPRLTTGAGLLTSAPILIDDSPSLSVLELRAKCRRLRAEKKLGLVVVDYLQLMRGSTPAENRVQEISQISRGLKGLAKELEVPIIALSQLSRAVEQRGGSGRPQLSDLRDSGCLTADARVLRADTGAEVTMGELLASGERNIPVWTIDDSFRLVEGTMTHVFPSGEKEVFEMRLASGRSIKASANHPFLTLDGWRRLDQLSAGTRLAVPRRVPEATETREWPESHIVLMAHMIGDGCLAPRQPIHYTSADAENLAAVEDAARAFGVTGRLVQQENWFHLYLPAPYKLTHGKRNPIAAWFDRFGLYGKRSYEKFVPSEVFELPHHQIALFLRHLWATDGCVFAHPKQDRIYYATTSERLAEDVRHLLLRVGVQSRTKRMKKSTYRDCFQVHVTGRENQLRFLEDIGVHGARGAKARAALAHVSMREGNTNLDTVPREVWSQVRTAKAASNLTERQLQAAVGTAYRGSTFYKAAPSRERLMGLAAVLRSPELHALAESDLFWDEISSIESLGVQPVFDATVPGTHNFIANGIVTHNSIEQDADVVLFVYREVVYKPDTAEPGKAQLIIAKQRNGPTDDVDMTFLRECTKFVPYSPVMSGETEPGF